MADVRPLAGSRTPGSERDRGQLILVMGLALALTIVALALILNSTIYTENLATRDDAPPSIDAIEYRERAREGVAGALAHVNRHDNSTTTEAINTSVKKEVANWTILAAQYEALNGRTANTTLDPDDITWGTRIGQNGDRNFTNANGDPSWILASDISNVTRFRMNISNESLTDPTDDNKFSIVFVDETDGTIERINITTSGDTRIRVANSSNECIIEGSRAKIDFIGGYTQAIENGTKSEPSDCPMLELFAESDGPYRIEFDNADSVYGIYEFSIGKDYDQLDTADYSTGGADTTDNAPYASWAIESAVVTVRYESPSLRYGSNVTVEPYDPETIRPTETTP